MKDRHRRSFWTLLWDGFKQNWTGWQPGCDEPRESEPIYYDIRRLSGVSEYATFQVWRQYPLATNDANRLADREVDEDFDNLPV